MKTIFLITLLSLPFAVAGQVSTISMNKLVLDAVKEMPTEGGYELTVVPAERMAQAFTLRTPDELQLNPTLAVPSYCTTATYMVFFKALEKFWAANSLKIPADVLFKLRPQMENDGVRIWGRWNSNGPGTAKFFHDTKIGSNFDDLEKALPGDFIKIFWNEHIGKLERGHTGVFLGLKKINGKPMLHFWASSKSTNGFFERIIPLTDAKRILFSRLDQPQNYLNIAKLPDIDPFLASMLTDESNWVKVREVSGF